MSRQLEQAREDRQLRLDARTLWAMEGGLISSLEETGVVLAGLSVRLNGGDVLMTLRGESGGEAVVSFVGSETFAGAVRKAVREGKRGGLRWKKDQWADR